MKNIVILLLFLNAVGCKPLLRPVEYEPPIVRKDYKIEFLFEHEGCKVYKFNDDGRIVYFTNCRGETTATTDTTVIRNTTNMKN